MSTSRGDLEQYSPIDFDPLVGLHRPPPCQGGTAARPKSGEQLGEIEQSSESANEEAGEIEQSSESANEESGEIEQSSESANEESGEIEQSSESPHEELGWEKDLCHAICVNNWIGTKAILDQHPDALTAGIHFQGRTALHVAAQFGNITIVKELLELVPREFLLKVDSHGDTALAMACWYNGNTEIAKCLINKNSDIVTIPNEVHFLPVTLAFQSDFKEMGRYLYSVTPLGCFTALSGSKLLRFCFQAQCFDIALDLLRQREELLFVPSDHGERKNMPLHQIATLNTVILSPSELIFWKRWIYDYINIPSTTAINHVSVDIQQDRSQGDQAKLTESWHGLLLRFIPSIDNFVGVKKIQELKLLHAQVHDLLILVCQNARKAFYKRTVIGEALRLAAKEGNVEFLLQVSKAIPEIFLDELMVDCFTEALVYRQDRFFNLIHGLRFKHGLVTGTEADENTLIHTAAMKAPDQILNRIYAPTLQMQRELQWFKEVESLMPPRFKGLRNKNGLTAKELFRKSHRELMKEGEKWIKDTASSCSVVGTLIVTIMFAVVFTVPGGNDQNLGYPLFIKQPFFKVFIFSTIISFLSSSTSILMFLAILTSQYSEEKFLKSLPTKLILGLCFLFTSIVSMMIAFLSTTYLMFNHTNYSWGLLPIMILASVPIFLFVLSQLPLLLHTYVSTYGNLFDKNVEPWP